jgi:hypothetical protein
LLLEGFAVCSQPDDTSSDALSDPIADAEVRWSIPPPRELETV